MRFQKMHVVVVSQRGLPDAIRSARVAVSHQEIAPFNTFHSVVRIIVQSIVRHTEIDSCRVEHLSGIKCTLET